MDFRAFSSNRSNSTSIIPKQSENENAVQSSMTGLHSAKNALTATIRNEKATKATVFGDLKNTLSTTSSASGGGANATPHQKLKQQQSASFSDMSKLITTPKLKKIFTETTSTSIFNAPQSFNINNSTTPQQPSSSGDSVSTKQTKSTITTTTSSNATKHKYIDDDVASNKYVDFQNWAKSLLLTDEQLNKFIPTYNNVRLPNIPDTASLISLSETNMPNFEDTLQPAYDLVIPDMPEINLETDEFHNFLYQEKSSPNYYF